MSIMSVLQSICCCFKSNAAAEESQRLIDPARSTPIFFNSPRLGRVDGDGRNGVYPHGSSTVAVVESLSAANDAVEEGAEVGPLDSSNISEGSQNDPNVSLISAANTTVLEVSLLSVANTTLLDDISLLDPMLDGDKEENASYSMKT